MFWIWYIMKSLHKVHYEFMTWGCETSLTQLEYHPFIVGRHLNWPLCSHDSSCYKHGAFFPHAILICAFAANNICIWWSKHTNNNLSSQVSYFYTSALAKNMVSSFLSSKNKSVWYLVKKSQYIQQHTYKISEE